MARVVHRETIRLALEVVRKHTFWGQVLVVRGAVEAQAGIFRKHVVVVALVAGRQDNKV